MKVHVAGAAATLLTGAAIFLSPKGRGLHKPLGWMWVALMGVTAVSSFFIRMVIPGSYSPIHALSAWVLIGLPMGLAAIRRRNVQEHRRHMTNMFLRGMLIAGLFTLLPGRTMWAVFFTY
ncbi:MAG: DUF2306 domain-containing protein [Hyphomonadaceae bacterium]